MDWLSWLHYFCAAVTCIWFGKLLFRVWRAFKCRGDLPPRQLQALLMFRLHGRLYPEALSVLIGAKSLLSVHRLLDELVNRKLITYTWETEEQAIERQLGWRQFHNEMPVRHRYYSLTPDGIAALTSDYATSELRSVRYLLMSRP